MRQTPLIELCRERIHETPPEGCDAWGNVRGCPCLVIEERHGENFVRILIYEIFGVYAYSFQLRMGSLVRQKTANAAAPMFASLNEARRAAGGEIEGICGAYKNSKKEFVEFQKIHIAEFEQMELFGGTP
ncbi:MAG: hypothetical protein LBC99_06475 [Spirochaetota bacterium]|jgi:hypothetical protein|nr:hypothetical protein [Spirochaetota bacterium]